MHACMLLCAGLIPSSNVKKQGFGASITLPDGRTFDWGKEQGLRAPFAKGEAQGVMMLAAHADMVCLN